MLGPEDVGHRVVVRHVVGHRNDRPLMSDYLGKLREITDDALVVDTARGPVTVPRVAVVAAKRVPPQRVTRRALAALEHAASEAWPAAEQERLGAWLLRAAGGWSMRANSALPMGDPGMPLPDAIDRVWHWYADRGLTPRVNVPLPLAATVDAALAARGWHAGQPVLVQTADLATVREHATAREPTAEGTPPGGPDVALTDSPTPEWLELSEGVRHHGGAGQLPPAARQVLTGDGQLAVRFAHIYTAEGRLLAAGRGTVTGEGRWLGLSRMAVAPAARRRGLARRVVAALTTWADQLGAADAFLQVEEDNAAAQALYAGLGFATHHQYLTRTAPDQRPDER